MKAAELSRALRKAALALDGIEEGVACEGTPVERRTMKVAKKAFVFLGPSDVMMKLGPSLDEAKVLAEKHSIKPGATGWVKVFLDDSPPPLKVLTRWLSESYALMSAGPSRPKTASKKKEKKKARAR